MHATQNPDVIFTIATDVNENINSTYIPPTSRTVNTGSKTTSWYNPLTKKMEYTTQQNNTTYNEGGYTKETKTADIYLVVDPNFNPKNELTTYAGWMTFPYKDRSDRTECTMYAPIGVVPNLSDFTIVETVKPGSRAEMVGLQPGDELIKAKQKNNNYKYDVKQKGWAAINEYNHYDMKYPIEIEIKRNGKKMKFILEPKGIEFTTSLWHY